jgi:hypothetical protein
MKRILLATIVAFFMSNAYGATEWCVNDTMKCAHGTPPLSKLKLADRQASLYKLTVSDRNAAVAEGLYIPVTVNELIRLAKEYLASQVVIPEPEVCPENTTGTFPDCVPVVIEPETCDEGFEGTPPNCTPIVIPEPPPVTQTWSKCADLWGWCSTDYNNQTVRIGKIGQWLELNFATANTCNPHDVGWTAQYGENHSGLTCEKLVSGTTIPTEPEPPLTCEPPLMLNGTSDACIMPIEPEPTPIPPPHNHGNMPHVDESQQMTTATGFNTLRVRSTSRQTGDSNTGGDFRVTCDVAKMGTFDPIVYPNQARAGHHHTFFGNTSINGSSTTASLASSGNSTCHGGIGNRSAYWIPSLINTITNAPLKPDWAMFYYKDGDIEPPNGLVILAGDMTASPTNQQATGWSPEVIRWMCNDVYTGRQNHIPACSGKLSAMVQFPMWWDGRLDSPDHKSHMSYSQTATHNKQIPDITYNIHWTVSGTSNLRLSSDNYVGGAGGYSLHADYMFAWDENVLNTWFNGCIKARKDCQGNLLGNGLELY